MHRKDPITAIPELLHPIQCPPGHTEASLLELLQAFKLEGDSGAELDDYLREDLRRFIYTLQLVPPAEAGSRLLEIGANPYFISILLRRFTSYDLSFTNYFGRNGGFEEQRMRDAASGETLEFRYANCNIDAEDLPFAEPFDTVLCCQLLEHLATDPIRALLRIKHSLCKDGALILTTSNVARLENVARLIAGENLYDPFSAYGAYGRRNREYSRHELFQMLTHCGFEVEEMFTSDTHENRCNVYFPADTLSMVLGRVRHREFDLGQYLFVRARNRGPSRPGKPRWLYRSYPESELCE